MSVQRKIESIVEGVPALPRPREAAHVIKDDAEAIAVAHALAAEFVKGSAERDRTRRLPIAELDAFSQSGLWSINVPRRFGGPEVSYVTLARVIAIISAADPSHRADPAEPPRASSPPSGPSRTRPSRRCCSARCCAACGSATPSPSSAASARPSSTPASPITATTCWSPAASSTRPARCSPTWCRSSPSMTKARAWYAIAERDAPGLTVIDDWSSFGQRTTASGTVLIDQVKVPKTYLVPGYKGYDRPTADGAIFQIIQAAVDAGIARAALDETIDFVRTKSRPWVDSGLDHAWQDPYTIQAVGDLRLRLNAAEALLEKCRPRRGPRRGGAFRRVGGRGADRRRRGQGADDRGRRWPRPTSCSSSPARARPWASTISTATGAMPAPTRCMTPCAGNTRSWATTTSTASTRRCTPGAER